MGYDLLRVSQHVIEQDDIEAVSKQMASGKIARGSAVRQFEEALAEMVGAKYAVAVSSGTAALHLAMLVGGVCTGDTAAIPAITFIAIASAAMHCGAEVKICDFGESTGDASIIVPTHYAGHAVDISRTSTDLIEDACHALGASYSDESSVGSCPNSLMTCFSFHPTKLITTGEGGAITTNHKYFYQRLRQLRDNGRSWPKSELPGRYKCVSAGLNYWMSDINAALGLSQLNKWHRFANTRRALARRYWEYLPEDVVAVLKKENEYYDVPHIFPVRIDFKAIGKTRNQVRFALLAKGIETSIHYYPLHLNPIIGGKRGDCPKAERYYDQTLTLPLHAAMTEDDVKRVCTALKEIING